MGNRGSAVVETRTVGIGKYDNKNYRDNRVISYKYTLWNFPFKNMFEQFRRVANLYFLCIGIMAGVIPDSPDSAWATLGPLIFVVAVSAAKQGYEDYLRHRADNKINNSLVTVVRDGVLQEITCKKVCVGDIVRVGRDGDIPCDIVMLISSHPDSKGYITTANLDGETNLKTVECALDTDLTSEHLPHLVGTIVCDSPTVDLYQFHGNITISLSQGEGDFESLNPVFVKDDYKMGSVHGDSCRGRHRCSFSKLHFLEQREYSAPLTATNLLLRGSRLRNTEYVFGCAVYTGQETKLALNSILTTNKFSIMEKSVNKFLIFFFVMMMIEVFVSTLLTLWFETDVMDSVWYMSTDTTFNFKTFLQYMFVYIILYYYIIPISLYVTMEMQRFLGSVFFGWDLEMFHHDQGAICNTSDLNEELGQVQFLFSDKTGTLTENDMQFRRCSIEGTVYMENGGQLLLLPPSGSELSAIPLPQWTPEVEQFLLAMALCHTAQTVADLSGNLMSFDDTDYGTATTIPEYQASSPDERSLVEAAARCGVVFLGTEGGFLTVSVRGQIRKYKKLQTLEFCSERKRMSVVVADNADQVWLFCKGAEVSMMPLMVSGHREETIRHYTDFSMRGLRTLVFGVKKLEALQYQTLARALRLARSVLDQTSREAQISEASNNFEQGLHLQGATAVEDRLQEKVPETLELLKTAGIKVWVLTGDKVETAVSIAYSCGHFKQGTHRLDLTGLSNETDCLSALQGLRCRIAQESLGQYGLVVDGTSLRLALRHGPTTLRDISLNCAAVLCCRLSPKQKAEVVSMVKKSEGRPTVAAVGDGANDVSMIQEANVGLGIVGKEGRQAVRCSDYGFSKFHFLARAFLVHGQWYYLRSAILFQYFFYKNVVFITPQLYFSLLNGMSPQRIYLGAFLALYNTIFTASPILVYSLFEQNFPASLLLARPELYKLHRHNRLMSWSHFSQWLVVGVWHSLVVYFVPAILVNNNPILLYNDTPWDIKCFGLTILHNIILVVNLKLWMHSSYWTFLFILSVALTILTFVIFCLIYNIIFFTGNAIEMYHIYFLLLLSPEFWLQSLLTVVLSLLPDLILTVFLNQKFRKPRFPSWASWLPMRKKGMFEFPTNESKT